MINFMKFHNVLPHFKLFDIEKVFAETFVVMGGTSFIVDKIFLYIDRVNFDFSRYLFVLNAILWFLIYDL